LRLAQDAPLRGRAVRGAREGEAGKQAEDPLHGAQSSARGARRLHQCVTRCSGTNSASAQPVRHFWLLGVFLAALAQAQQPDHDFEFRALDLNGDGQVSLAEAAGNFEVVTRFERADRNRDGKLTRAEFERLKKLKTRVAGAKKDKDRSAATGGTAKPR